jgi:hypothetical protein
MPCHRGRGGGPAFVWHLVRATSTHLQAGRVPTLRYTSLGGATHTSSVTEVAEWVQSLSPSVLSPPTPVSTHLPSTILPPPSSPRPRDRRNAPPLIVPPSPSHPPPEVYPPPTPPYSPLKPLSRFSLRPPHSPSCILVLPRHVRSKPRRGRPASHLFLRPGASMARNGYVLACLKCLLPVIRSAKTQTYLKRVVKEKWDEVNRLRKRRVRWTIGGDKINVRRLVGVTQ